MSLKSHFFLVVLLVFALAGSDVRANESPAEDDEEEESNKTVEPTSEFENYVNSE